MIKMTLNCLFGNLHARSLLYKQAELTKFEKELADNIARKELMDKIDSKMKEYGWPFSFSSNQVEVTNTSSKDREVRIFEIPGLLAEYSTKALGDYGAKKNFIKEEYAVRLGLPINRDI